MKKNKGVWQRFVICAVVYCMIAGVILVTLTQVFPSGFKETWVKLLIIGGAIILFLIGFAIVETIRAKKG